MLIYSAKKFNLILFCFSLDFQLCKEYNNKVNECQINNCVHDALLKIKLGIGKREIAYGVKKAEDFA